MSNMPDSIAERRKMPLLFTTVDGKVFELDTKELPPSSYLHPDNAEPTTTPTNPAQGAPEQLNLAIPTLDGPSSNSSSSPRSPRTPRSRCGTPLIEIIAADKMPVRVLQPVLRKGSHHKRHIRTNSGIAAGHDNTGVKVPMRYNEYGELVPASIIDENPVSEELNVTQLLRVIKKAYHHDLRSKLSKLLNPHPDGGDSVLSQDNIWSYRLSSWDLRLRTPTSASPSSIASQTSPEYGQRRVLELGASDGDWCFAFKKQQPDWIIHGLDDTDHWACFDRGIPLRDFMRSPKNQGISGDYFGGATVSHMSFPEFTERNLNSLLMHENPLQTNYYEFIRARGIFDRIESYKMFLEDIRSLLKPDGVVEFIEVDPRPRLANVNPATEDNQLASVNGQRGKKRSTAAIDWTDKIEDRFRDPLDLELASDVPGWSRRVAERMKANLRPRDGVVAANLKSWLEGAGFWDVKQSVLPIPVGGPTQTGKFLKEYLLYQIEIENCIPKLLAELPEAEVEEMQNGKYHLNFHIVTGRKPMHLRTGDLMINGERREMTNSKYDAMAKFEAIKSSQWKRFDLEANLDGIMQNLTTLSGAPEALHRNRGAAENSLTLIGRHPDVASPFNAPPFVTYKEMEDHITEIGGGDVRSQSGRTTGLTSLG